MMRKEARDSGAGARGGVIRNALAMLAGAAVVQLFATLPPVWLACALGVAGLVVAWRWPRLTPLAVFVCALAWTAWRAALVLDMRLPRDLEGRDFELVGRVSGLGVVREGATSFDFIVDAAQLAEAPIALDGTLRLAWYGAAQNTPAPCTRWAVRARLKRPRGMLNPGGFDSERQALQRRRSAVGYLRTERVPEPLGTSPWCVDRAREAVSRAIEARLGASREAELLKALAVADTRGLKDADWDVARVTGVSHLLAISGFHVGVAALGGVFLARLLWWLVPGFGLRVPRHSAEAAAAVAVGIAYGALAGFGLPTLRTLLMIGVTVLAFASRRVASGAQALALALIAILVADPLAVLSAGFWLSFAGVAFLLLGFARPRRLIEHVKALGSAQWAMTIALLPLSVAFFGQAAPLGALANLVAIPLVSLVVVPLTLIGVVALPLSASFAGLLWQLAASAMHGLWALLAAMAAWPASTWYLPLAPLWAVALALLGAIWMLLPRGLPLRWLGCVLFVPLLAPRLPELADGAFRAEVIDVGQGLAVLVRTRHHDLLYDAGARYPSGFDVGAAAVLPTLRALGVRELDLFIVSHGDNDHAGGAGAITAAYPRVRRMTSEVDRRRLKGFDPCVEGAQWQWDEVRFRMLHAPAAGARAGNDASCVLLVEGAAGRLLLPGDITARVEWGVAQAAGAGAPLVLVVAHHGSKTSSSEGFLRALEPKLAVVSSGWRNRYGHPAPPVVARFAALGIPLIDTAEAGAVGIDFPRDAAPRMRWNWRAESARYWHE